ncbi:MAG: prepilin peptidase [Promethearchaeia archaeon]
MEFLFLYVVLFVCCYLDLKKRMISNNYMKFFYIISILLIIIKVRTCSNFIKYLNYFQFIVIFTLILITFFLFFFKIIGGADGKLIILIFLINLEYNLTFSNMIHFFFIFFFLYFFYISISLLINFQKFKSNLLFFFLQNKFNKYKIILIISILKSISLKRFNKDKNIIPSFSFLYYNFNKNKLELLIQERIPITCMILISYILNLLY